MVPVVISVKMEEEGVGTCWYRTGDTPTIGNRHNDIPTGVIRNKE